MIKGSYDSNPKLCPLNHLLTRVKSRDASASKKVKVKKEKKLVHYAPDQPPFSINRKEKEKNK